MHVPLSELGETWIDAGVSEARFRAAIYLDRADVRDRVSAALPELQAELGRGGFAPRCCWTCERRPTCRRGRGSGRRGCGPGGRWRRPWSM
jgi:hypothetical protein